MLRFIKSLFGQVVIALIAGVAVGWFYPDFAQGLKPLGDGFIKMVTMIVPVIVFCVVVQGICGASDLKKVGSVGVKAIIYFEVVTSIALLLGLLMAFVFKPGVGMNIDPTSLDPTALSNYVATASKVKSAGFSDFIMKMIPSTIVSAFTSGDVLQVLLISIIFGSALLLIGEKGRPAAQLIGSLSDAFFKCMSFIIRLAPLGVFGAIAFTVGRYGIGSLQQLAILVLLFYATVAIFVLVILGGILRTTGFSIFKLIGYLREELIVVLATTSSDSVLPQIMQKLEHMGIKKSTVGLVIPTGYSFNLDAFSIYLTMAAVFIAQATNTHLAMGDLLAILIIALITSKGAHGVPGSAIVILAATLTTIPAIPVVGLVLVLSIDWFIGIARAVGNLLGNCVATVVVASWEKDIDKQRARAVLNGEVSDAALN
ncbi:aerobic C4-dicarboxylate transport protein [Herbaspirillum sp. Sphag1AN]|uniref:C4-dicarboxylate transporter DctA n=1 Tax=unclassified Herbaspirillum TaxID=2624150 RepID=UPI00161C07AF|nr:MULTISPECIES: C4-dicarboxylate transporter DctA [unclassified Herbaspirillum]MBB3212265.1 aerobic C4-dicarboxylate transport protein [Herbaspirillum sp. Sphag1AN]MBB3245637.1 aerobic C4-dicarboxylate transport protein [Herbaspirillum sp. Sphag64]